MGFLLIAVFLMSFTNQGKSEKIRCYCNFEECLLNNYQCSYEDGGCFSDFLDYRDITRARHGCLHLLKKEKQEQCGHSPGSVSSPMSLLLCCKTDMCNQVLSPASLFTQSIIGSLINTSEVQKLGRNENQYQPKYNTNEVWFKAATIAVPICGAMILFLLVALAFKILRADHVNVRKYCGKAKSNTGFIGSHTGNFNAPDLNSKDFYKKIPLLCETRQDELQNCESFRNYTSVRIHFGQNVNMLKDNQGVSKADKNLENEKINLGKSRALESNVPNTSRDHSEEINNALSVEFHTGSMMNAKKDRDQTNLPIFSLNLNKLENFNSCNVYRNSKSEEHSSASVTNSVRADLSKVYDKYLL